MADAPAKSSVRLTEVEIEFGDRRNRCKMFPPTREKYRGSWMRQNMVSDEMTEDLAKMPDLPGIRIRLNPETRIGVAYDPLALPEFVDTLRKAEAAHKEVFHTPATAMKDVKYEDLDATTVKSWLYWMRRMVNNGDAKIVKGTLPSLEEITVLSGKTQMESWNSSSRACKFREDAEDYLGMLMSQQKNR